MKRIISISLALALSACGSAEQLSPEQQVRLSLSTLEEAVEARSLSQIMAQVSDDYLDHRGQRKKDIKRLMQIQLLRNQKISVFTRIRSLEVNGNTASVELSAAMAARGVDLSLETNRLKADTHRFSVDLIQDDNQWLINSVSWQRGW